MKIALITAAALTALAIAASPGVAVASEHEGDRAAGQRVYNTQCRACHTLNQGGRNGVGPNLWGFFGRAAGAVEGFRYSAAMREKATGGLVWNNESVGAYLANPKAVVPSGTMSFVGLRNPKQIADVIAYLRHETAPH